MTTIGRYKIPVALLRVQEAPRQGLVHVDGLALVPERRAQVLGARSESKEKNPHPEKNIAPFVAST